MEFNTTSNVLKWFTIDIMYSLFLDLIRYRMFS